MIRLAREAKRRGGCRRLPQLSAALGGRSIVLVGMPGCGKSSVGRRLAPRLDLPFVDADEEIESAAGKPITDIFKDHGEPYFRDGERKVIARLLGAGPQVLATGGGALHDRGRHATTFAAPAFPSGSRPSCRVLMRRVSQAQQPAAAEEDPEGAWH